MPKYIRASPTEGPAPLMCPLRVEFLLKSDSGYSKNEGVKWWKILQQKKNKWWKILELPSP